MSEQHEYEFTPKGDAFTRYFFIDRGSEADLSLEEAMVDFENYIYRPIAADAARRLVVEVVDEALGEHIDLGSDPDLLTEEDMENVAQHIGVGFLAAYLAINSDD